MKTKDPEIIHINPVWLKDLKKRIKKGFGKKCPDFEVGCATCMAWLSHDILKDLYGWKWKE